MAPIIWLTRQTPMFDFKLKFWEAYSVAYKLYFLTEGAELVIYLSGKLHNFNNGKICCTTSETSLAPVERKWFIKRQCLMHKDFDE